MMTIVNTQPQRALIGVWVCAVYLALWAIAALAIVITSANTSAFGLLVIGLAPVVILFVVTAFKLWQVRAWARIITSVFFVLHTLWPLLFIDLSKVTVAELLYGTLVTMIGITGLIFLNRPAVKALFQSQQH